MAYDVTFTIPARELGRADIEFKVDSDKKRLGTLKISKGALVWVPPNYEKGYRLKWSEFDDLARKHGSGGHR